MNTKNGFLLFPLVLMGVLFILTVSCKKDDNNNSNTVKDIDGNVYHTVTIGTQTCMVENLKTTKYRNGDPIPNITDGTEWGNLSTGAYCDYENTPGNSVTYGRLYNWFVVNDNRNIAPLGWHIPNETEYNILADYLGGEDFAGGKLKEVGMVHWQSPNKGATNESGLICLPAGYRVSNGDFFGLKSFSFMWLYNGSESLPWFWDLNYDSFGVGHYYYNKFYGFSVRCIKDN